MGGHATKEVTAADVTLPDDSGWRKLPILAAVAGVLGLAGTFALGDEDGTHLWSYLIAVLYWISIGVGATFFVLIFSLTRAEWHVAARRPMEAMMRTLPLAVLLLAPIMFMGQFDHIYPWAVPGVTDVDPVIAHKAGYLNEGFFKVRYLVYLVVMGGVATYFGLQLKKQDTTGDHEISRRLRAHAAPGLAVMSLAVTFLAFDWMMSTDPHWFSTIYGIIFFAGGFMGAHALLAMALISFRSNMGGAVTQHHFHGTGKMMWGLMVFWAYTSFAQFMLIWYANIPEETLWYAHRWDGGWKTWTIILFLGHFIFPFFAMMSRHLKREPRTLFAAAVWLLIMHWIDLYWQLKPNMHHGHGPAALSATDVLAFVGVGGVYLAASLKLFTSGLLVPIKDPMLRYSMAYEDV